MKKNYIISFKVEKDLDELINNTLTKLNKESTIKIVKSDFIRAALYRTIVEIKIGKLTAAEFLFR